MNQYKLADDLKRSRQGVNFYCQGKRVPDIIIAGEIAEYFNVSCDYLLGFSDYRSTELNSTTLEELGITETAVQIFGELKMIADGKYQHDRKKYEDKGIDYEKTVLSYIMEYGKTELILLNKLLANERFRVLMQYVKKYYDIKNGNETLKSVDDVVIEVESQTAAFIYGTKEEENRLKEDFILYTAGQYISKIIKDISI